MNANDPRRSEENSEDNERQAPWQFPPANEVVLNQAPSQEFTMAQVNFYPPPPMAPHHSSTAGSYHVPRPQNAAYSAGGHNYFMPPYQSQFSPFQYGVAPYNMAATVTQQSPFSTFRQIAPKPPQQSRAEATCSSGSKPPDFIDTVKEIRRDLYSRGKVAEDQDPPVLDSKEYSDWRKSVIDRWKPHNMSHYLMVAKMSKKCFDLVLELPQRLNQKVTQGDFIHLYKKSNDEQYQVLKDLLEQRVSLQDVKRRKRGKEAISRETGTNKELEEEIARLKSQNVDLRIKLNEAIEERDNERRRANRLEQRIRILERENEDEFRQFRADVDDLQTENNVLRESFLEESFKAYHDTSSSNSHQASSASDESSAAESEDDVPLSEYAKAKSTTEEKQTSRAEDSSESDELSSTSESSSAERRGGSSVTSTIVAERTRMTGKGSKNKSEEENNRSKAQKSSTPAKPRSSLTGKAPQKRVTQTAQASPSQKNVTQAFQDEWDYDLRKLEVKEWVAVAYEQAFYVGRVEKILANKARINFLIEHQGFFIWPRPQDKDDVHSKFIFCRNIEVAGADDGELKFSVKNFELLKTKFKAFSLKYF